MIEIYKKLVLDGTETNYIISSYGSVYNTKTKHELKQTIRKNKKKYNNYVQVTLIINGKSKTKLVHRLVAITFISNPNNFPTINHDNGIKTNNHVSNLYWCTQAHNNKHAYDTGLKISLKGENVHFNKYAEKTIIDICEDLSKEYTITDLSKKYNIPVSTVRGIHSKERWKHITKNYNFNSRIKRYSKKRSTKLKIDIHNLLEDHTNVEIINILGLDVNMLNRNYVAMMRHRSYNKKEGSTTIEKQEYYRIESV